MFKVGDKVVCIDTASMFNDMLNQTYTVIRVTNSFGTDYLTLDKEDINTFFATSFTLVKHRVLNEPDIKETV